MKRIKRYLNRTLIIAFFASINTFAMEIEKSNTSGEWSDYQPIGESNTSSESLESSLSLLESQINELERINNTINNILGYNLRISFLEYKKLQEVQKNVQKTLATARDMLLNRIPTDTNFIHQQMKLISAQQQAH